jgi:hypothetical protein
MGSPANRFTENNVTKIISYISPSQTYSLTKSATSAKQE